MGFRRVYEEHRQPLLAYLDVHFSFQEDERYDVLQEAILALWRDVRRGTFDPDRPLRPFLFEIARRRAIDLLRRKTVRRGTTSYPGDDMEDALTKLGARLADMEAGKAYRGLTTAEKDECMTLIRAAIPGLPPSERRVMQVKFAYPLASPEEIRERASQLARKELTVVAVKRAEQRAAEKVAEVLRRKGYSERGTP